MRCVCAVLVCLLVNTATATAQPLPIPNGDTKALFASLVVGKPFGQATLLALEPTLAQYCIALTPPNAAGDRTKIGDPVSGHWVRVGFGEGDWVWVVQGDVYTPHCDAPPGPDLEARVTDLEARLTTANLTINAIIDHINTVLPVLDARLSVLEAKKIPTSCRATVIGIPISCKLN